MERTRIALAEHDIKLSRRLHVIRSFLFLKEKDGTKGVVRNRRLIYAVGELERGDAWSSYIRREPYGEEKDQINTHTAVHVTENGAELLEVVIFRREWQAETAAEEMDTILMNKLKPVEEGAFEL